MYSSTYNHNQFYKRFEFPSLVKFLALVVYNNYQWNLREVERKKVYLVVINMGVSALWCCSILVQMI